MTTFLATATKDGALDWGSETNQCRLTETLKNTAGEIYAFLPLKELKNIMNETYYLKFSGKVNIPESLSIGHNYKLLADCSIVSEERHDNEDGTLSVVYKIMPVTCEVAKDNGKTVKAKDPRRNSVKIRNYLFKQFVNEGCEEDFDKIYDAFSWEVMAMTPQLLQEAIKRVQKE